MSITQPDVTLSFAIAVDPIELRAARLTIESFARDHGFRADRVAGLALAVAEALFNAVDHGGCCNDLAFGVRLDPAGLEVAIENDRAEHSGEEAARALRATLLRQGADAPDPEQERGRGLHLMHARVDDVRVENTTGGRVRVVLVVRR